MNLLRLAQAYRTCFLQAQDTPKGWFNRFKKQVGLPTQAGEIVLANLARFCRATKPTSVYLDDGSVDPIASARMDGRREVFLWINECLYLDHKTLIKLMERENDRYSDDD